MLTQTASWLNMLEAALAGAAQPWAIGLALALTTLLLEDLAIAAGAALAAQGLVSWEWAMISVGLGIGLGDLGLYGLGLAANRVPYLRRRLIERDGRVSRAGRQLHRRLGAAILLARVIPGLRLVTYTACGFFRLPWWPFCIWVALAVTVWTVGLMAFGAWLGGPLGAALGLPPAVAVAIPIVVLALGLSLIQRTPAPSDLGQAKVRS